MMYSLFGACKVLNKNPERWLCHVLKNIKTTPNLQSSGNKFNFVF